MPDDDQSITKSDIASVKNKEQIRAIERKGNIKAANDWIGFGVSKGAGLGCLIGGGLEWIDPNILPIVLERPEYYAGAGLAILAGKGVLDLIVKITKSLGGE